MEFEWKIFPGFTACGILGEIQKLLIDLKCEPEQFHVTTTLNGENEETEKCIMNSFTVAN